MIYHTRNNFKVLSYDKHTFAPKIILFDQMYYNVDNENDEYVYINNCIFTKKYKKIDIRYLYDYFYTKQEERKLKLKKLNEFNTSKKY